MTSVNHFCKVDNNTQNEIVSGELYRSLEGGDIIILKSQIYDSLNVAHLKDVLARIVLLMQAQP